MQPQRYYYLIKLQYLGFRYHGWQKQPDVNTVERMLERTLSYILDRARFKVIAAGRTDAKVSVNQTYVELFLYENELECDGFLELMNKNLPPDIRALGIEETTRDFNIIKHAKVKEYHYFFTFAKKFHPFAAPFMAYVKDDLDIDLMAQAASLFVGKHDFRAYAFRPSPQTVTTGEIFSCELVENDLYTANFFPEKSYVFKIKGSGFKRHQIRLMMGVLIDLGRGDVNLDFIKATLNPDNDIKLEHIAPASGLILHQVKLNP